MIFGSNNKWCIPKFLFTVDLGDGGAQLVVGLYAVFRAVDITLQLGVAQVRIWSTISSACNMDTLLALDSENQLTSTLTYLQETKKPRVLIWSKLLY